MLLIVIINKVKWTPLTSQPRVMRLIPEFSLMPVREVHPLSLSLPHALLVPPSLLPSFPEISSYQDNNKHSSSSAKSQEAWARINFSIVLFTLNGTICAHHLNSINLIRQEISSQNCLSIRWTWPNSIWRENVMAALISQVSSNQNEKWKNNVNIISSYNGPVSLLSQLHRVLNISNVLWDKLFIHSNIGCLLCGSPLFREWGCGRTNKIKFLPSWAYSGWWEIGSHDKNREF